MGAWADRLDRRLALLGVLIATLLSSAAMAALAWPAGSKSGISPSCCFINGTAWASDNAVRRILIGDVVGAERMATAIALDIGANNASRMIGPALGGVLLASGGVEAAFLFSVGLYLMAIAAALGLKYREQRSASGDGVDAEPSSSKGLREVRRRRELQGLLMVTAIYNLFGWPFYSLVPVIGKDNLALGPEGVGVLSSMDGVGAMMGAAWVILLAKPAHYHALYICAAAVFQLMMVGFALTSQPLLRRRHSCWRQDSAARALR